MKGNLYLSIYMIYESGLGTKSKISCKMVIIGTNNSWGVCLYPGPWFNIKMLSYQYRKSHCGDKTILRPSYLHNGISYTGKMVSLYWIRALVICKFPNSLCAIFCEYGYIQMFSMHCAHKYFHCKNVYYHLDHMPYINIASPGRNQTPRMNFILT